MVESEVSGPANIYRISPLYQVFLYLAATALAAAAFAGFWFADPFMPTSAEWAFRAGAVALLTAGGYVALWAHNACVILNGDTITVRGVWFARSLERNEIRGRRIRRSGHSTETVLVPIYEGSRKIALSSSFRGDPALSGWIASLHDLDLEAAQLARSEIEDDASLGQDANERMQAAAGARKIARNLQQASVVIAGWSYVYPRPYGLVVGALVALPLLALLLSFASRSRFRLAPLQGSLRGDLSVVILVPSLALLFRVWQDVHLLRILDLVRYACGAAALLITLALFATKRAGVIGPSLLVTAASLCAYAWSAVVLVNVQLDHATPASFHSALVNKYITSGKRHIEMLTLGPWGDVEEEFSLPVDPDLYAKVRKGQVLCVALHHGSLHAQWYVVDACNPPWTPPACTLKRTLPMYPVRTDSSDDGQGESTRQLLVSGDFAPLDARLNGLQSAWELGEIDDVVLQQGFRAFYTADPTLEPAFARWLAAFPSSYAAHLAHAIFLRERGLKVATNVQRDAMYEQALSELDRARTNQPVLSEQLRMSIASYRRDSRALQIILARGIKIAPHNFILRRKYLYSLRTAEGGSHDRMVAYRKELEGQGLTPSQSQALDAMVLADEGWILSRMRSDLDSAAKRYAQAINLARPVRLLLENLDFAGMLGDGAWIASDLKDDATALAYEDELLALTPNDADNVARRAGSLLRMGRMREGLEGLDRAAGMGDAWAQNQLGTHYWWGDQVVAVDQRKALALFACAIRNGEPAAVRNLDWSLINFGK